MADNGKHDDFAPQARDVFDFDTTADDDAEYDALLKRRKAARVGPLSVLFTGFSDLDKSRMIKIAEAAGYTVSKSRSLSRKLDILVTGDNPGPSKMADARSFGVEILTCSEFLEMAKTTGIVPESFQGDILEEKSDFFGSPKKRLSPGDISMSIVGAPRPFSKAHLFRLAEAAGFVVYGYGSAPPKNLSILVVGEEPGTVFVERARKNGTRIMAPREFIAYLKAGVNREELKTPPPKKGAALARQTPITDEETTKEMPDGTDTPVVTEAQEPTPQPTESPDIDNRHISECEKELEIIIQAITCDDIITQGEFQYLCHWLNKYAWLESIPKRKQLFDLVEQILEDGVVTADELDSLNRFLRHGDGNAGRQSGVDKKPPANSTATPKNANASSSNVQLAEDSLPANTAATSEPPGKQKKEWKDMRWWEKFLSCGCLLIIAAIVAIVVIAFLTWLFGGDNKNKLPNTEGPQQQQEGAKRQMQQGVSD